MPTLPASWKDYPKGVYSPDPQGFDSPIAFHLAFLVVVPLFVDAQCVPAQ